MINTEVVCQEWIQVTGIKGSSHIEILIVLQGLVLRLILTWQAQHGVDLLHLINGNQRKESKCSTPSCIQLSKKKSNDGPLHDAVRFHVLKCKCFGKNNPLSFLRPP